MKYEKGDVFENEQGETVVVTEVGNDAYEVVFFAEEENYYSGATPEEELEEYQHKGKEAVDERLKADCVNHCRTEDDEEKTLLLNKGDSTVIESLDEDETLLIPVEQAILLSEEEDAYISPEEVQYVSRDYVCVVCGGLQNDPRGMDDTPVEEIESKNTIWGTVYQHRHGRR